MKGTTFHGGSTSNKIELNIFTNATVDAPSTDIIERTYHSFLSTFGPVSKVTVWLDSKPNIENAKEYKKNLEEIFDNVNETYSLSDGYIRSIRASNSEFMFMLEHDWEFLQIDHTLDEICKQMNEHALTHLRFNKRDNIPSVGDSEGLMQVDGFLFPFCLTSWTSNNPHIIHRNRYLSSAFKHIRIDKGSKGIEEKLRNKHIHSAIYGPIGHPATIFHLNGRHEKYNQCPVCGAEKQANVTFCSLKCRENAQPKTETKPNTKVSKEELLAKQRHLIIQQKKIDRELKQVQKHLSAF